MDLIEGKYELSEKKYSEDLDEKEDYFIFNNGEWENVNK